MGFGNGGNGGSNGSKERTGVLVGMFWENNGKGPDASGIIMVDNLREAVQKHAVPSKTNPDQKVLSTALWVNKKPKNQSSPTHYMIVDKPYEPNKGGGKRPDDDVPF